MYTASEVLKINARCHCCSFQDQLDDELSSYLSRSGEGGLDPDLLAMDRGGVAVGSTTLLDFLGGSNQVRRGEKLPGRMGIVLEVSDTNEGAVCRKNLIRPEANNQNNAENCVNLQ